MLSVLALTPVLGGCFVPVYDSANPNWNADPGAPMAMQQQAIYQQQDMMGMGYDPMAGMAYAAYPAQGYAQQGFVQQGYAQQAYAQQPIMVAQQMGGYPNMGMVQTVYPQMSYTQGPTFGQMAAYPPSMGYPQMAQPFQSYAQPGFAMPQQATAPQSQYAQSGPYMMVAPQPMAPANAQPVTQQPMMNMMPSATDPISLIQSQAPMRHQQMASYASAAPQVSAPVHLAPTPTPMAPMAPMVPMAPDK
ncbi:putative Gamma-gliadin [Magnetofaba australis IT-1]|uniref:Putative Gamma-gliadin n=2 Tax=Magnetofaba TaxID=1472292 RepID=A0A1Y2K6M0_9PROT|nr:putative Gamma-gliadin [Magnetofaba australis IT-1]